MGVARFWSERNENPLGSVRVVASTKAKAPPTDTSAISAEADRIARSEREAALPPGGGPGPDDTRAPLVPSATRAIQDEGGLRLYGSGPAFAAAGFADGDLLIGVDNVDIAMMTDATEMVPTLLTPGAIVEILRNGRPHTWRIGYKAQ